MVPGLPCKRKGMPVGELVARLFGGKGKQAGVHVGVKARLGCAYGGGGAQNLA